MPKSADEQKVEGSDRGVQVVKFSDASNPWHDYPDLPGDKTPGNPIGRAAEMFKSADGRVTVGLWTRDADIGELVGSGQCFDFVIEGSVTVTDAKGVKHTASAGDLLIYHEKDQGTWEQPGPIRKFYIHIHD